MAQDPPKIGQWRWSQSEVFYAQGGMLFKHDKIEHAVCSGALYFSMKHVLKWSRAKSVLWSFGLAVLWEVKDAMIPYERVGWPGGEGFSYVDVLFDCAGIVVTMMLCEFVHVMIEPRGVTLAFVL